MRDVFESQLKTLKDDMIEMGSMIEKAIENAIRALNNRDTELARAAIEADSEIDEQEKKIESLCLKLLLHQQPVASDLRMVSSALKMITDMERIGDQTSDIADIIIGAGMSEAREIPVIGKMAEATSKMVNDSVLAYVNKDLELARKVMLADDEVDKLFDQTKQKLVKLIAEDHGNQGEKAIDLIMITKYLERIGDHATNIAEWVEFSITGVHKGMTTV